MLLNRAMFFLRLLEISLGHLPQNSAPGMLFDDSHLLSDCLSPKVWPASWPVAAEIPKLSRRRLESLALYQVRLRYLSGVFSSWLSTALLGPQLPEQFHSKPSIPFTNRFFNWKKKCMPLIKISNCAEVCKLSFMPSILSSLENCSKSFLPMACHGAWNLHLYF